MKEYIFYISCNFLLDWKMSDRTIKRIKIYFSNGIRMMDEKICGNLMYFFYQIWIRNKRVRSSLSNFFPLFQRDSHGTHEAFFFLFQFLLISFSSLVFSIVLLKETFYINYLCGNFLHIDFVYINFLHIHFIYINFLYKKSKCK